MGRHKRPPPQTTERIIGAHVAAGYVRVIRYPADGSLDYQIPAARAKQLSAEGKMWIDLTNQCYTTYQSKMGNNSGPIIR